MHQHVGLPQGLLDEGVGAIEMLQNVLLLVISYLYPLMRGDLPLLDLLANFALQVGPLVDYGQH